MAFYSRVMETTTTTGTGSITLSGTPVTGYRTWGAAVPLNVEVNYVIEGVDADGIPTGEFEEGEGYLTGSTTLVRDVVYTSSNSNALVSFSAGTKWVFATMPAYEMQSKGNIVAQASGTAMP